MVDTYHIAYRHAYDAEKEIDGDAGTGLSFEDAAYAFREMLTPDWILTGRVWTNKKSGTQMCIENDSDGDVSILCPVEDADQAGRSW